MSYLGISMNGRKEVRCHQSGYLYRYIASIYIHKSSKPALIID